MQKREDFGSPLWSLFNGKMKRKRTLCIEEFSSDWPLKANRLVTKIEPDVSKADPMISSININLKEIQPWASK